MKKTAAIFLVLAMVFTLAACSEPEETRKPNNDAHGATGPAGSAGTAAEMKTIYVLTSQKTTKYVDGELESFSEMTNYYDANGFMLRQERVSSNGTAVTYTAEHDAYGRVVRLSHTADGYTASYTYGYDQWGNVIRERFDRDVDYVSKSWDYDAHGNLISYEETEMFSSVSERYIYEDGKLHSIVKYRGDTQTGSLVYDYDDLGRIANVFYYDPGKDTPFCTDIYSHSDDGLTTCVDRVFNAPTLEHQEVTVVDAYDNIVRQETTEGGRKTVVEYTYQAIEVPADSPRKSDQI